jgi:cysteine desulfurase
MAIYLDHAATTPIAPEALAVLTAELARVGNASSLHLFGRQVRKEVEQARESIAAAIGAHPTEVIFTGSGTEANNLAVKGFYWRAVAENPERTVIVASAFEHHAILEPLEWLEAHEGATIIYIPITPEGVIDLVALAEIIRVEAEHIALIAVMHSNNEIGTIQPIAEVVKLAGDIPVHTDAVQSFGKVDFNFAEIGVRSATISSHKLGGPLGVAALILEHGLDITPILHGGGQERDIRSGTINAPSIVAFAAAVDRAMADRETNFRTISTLRAQLRAQILSAIPDASINGSSAVMLPGVLNLTFPGTESDSLLLLLDNVGIAASTGSACSAGVQRASHVLMSIGLSEDQARSSLRFSLGTTTTQGEIDEVGRKIQAVVESARAALSVGSGVKA